MANPEKILRTSPLFRNFAEENILQILKTIEYKITSFDKDQMIALEGQDLTSIGIVIEGSIEIQKIYPSGKTVTIAHLKEGDIFGEVIVFSAMSTYPSTIISVSNTEIMFIPKSDITKLCTTNVCILNNFMGLLSNKILMLNKKLRNLSYQTIREKISSYLLDEYSKQKKMFLDIPYSRQEMAEQFGVTRPSLSRELINMKSDGLIDFDRNIILIKDLQNLENCLF